MGNEKERYSRNFGYSSDEPVQRKVVEWAMRKKGIPETLVTAVMSLHKESSGMGNEKERYSRNFGYSSDEPAQRKVVEWAMRKKGIPETFVTAVMSLYKGK